jgi:hypothetical protein
VFYSGNAERIDRRPFCSVSDRPQIRSLVGSIEITTVCYRKRKQCSDIDPRYLIRPYYIRPDARPRDDVLAVGQRDPPDRDLVHLADGLADHREGVVLATANVGGLHG